jgi:hypothetical protein
LPDSEAGSEVIVRDGARLTNEEQSDGAPIEQRLAQQVHTLEAWYATEFERRLAELTEMLKMQLQIQTEELQQHYERREKTLQGKAQASSGAHSPEKLLEEIRYTEIVAHQYAAELERMVADDAVNLGLLLQKRNQHLELKAYLRGLKFSSESAQASPAAAQPNEIT